MKTRQLRRAIVTALVACALVATACSRHARLLRRLDHAETLYAAGRYDEAEIEYRNVLKSDVNQVDALARLGTIYLDDSRVGQALPFLQRARELAPNRTDVRATLGRALLAAGAASAARAEAVFALEHDPLNPDAPSLLVAAAGSPEDLKAARTRLLALPPAARERAPVLVALGELDMRAREAQAAEEHFRLAQQADPKSARAAAALGLLAWSRKDVAAADRALRQAYELAPARSSSRLQYVQFKLQAGETDAAKRLLGEITTSAPDYLPGWLWTAELALTDQRWDDAEAAVAHALARDPLHAESLLLRGRIALARNDTANAVGDLERAVALYPRFALAHYELGVAYGRRKDTEKARTSLLRANQLAPDFSPAALALAENFVQDGTFAPAVAILTKLVERNPTTVPARLLLAQAYQAQGSLEPALALYEDIERRTPGNGQIAYLRGLLLLRLNRPDAARAAFEQAIARSAPGYEALERLIDLDLAQKRYAAASARAAAAAGANLHAAVPRLLLAKIAIAEGKPAAAEEALRRAIDAEPDSPTAYRLLARMQVNAGQYDQARGSLELLLAKNPRDRQATTMMAVLHDVQKDYPAARAAYERLLTIDPEASIALNNLAYLYAEKFNLLDRARELAQHAHALAPSDPRTTDTLGWIAYRQGHYPEALALLRDSAAQLPAEPAAQAHLGLAAAMAGSENVAREALARAVAGDARFEGREEAEQRLAVLTVDPVRATPAEQERVRAYAKAHPGDPVALCRVAQWQRRAGNLREARASVEAALRTTPKNPRALAELAWITDAEGRAAPALELAKQAHTLAPDDPDATVTLGRLAFRAGDYRWAAGLLADAADASPDDAELLYDAAIAEYSVGRVADAVELANRTMTIAPDFTRAAAARRFVRLVAPAAGAPAADRATLAAETLRSDANDVPALMASAALSEARGDGKAAQAAYEKVLAHYPDFGPAQKALTLLYAASPAAPATAVALATRAREAFPRDPELAKAFGVIVYRQHDYTRAATLLQESAAARESDADVLYYLGMAQYQLKRKAESKHSLERALQLGLDADRAAEARRSLAALE